MLDLETLGVKTDAVFLSLAATQFDINTGHVGRVFYRTIELESSLRIGRKVESETIKWWLKQNPAVLLKMFENSAPLSLVLQEFTIFFHDISEFVPANNPVRIWGNSATFDVEKLGTAYDAFEMERPWNTFYERCYRSYVSEFKHLVADIPPRTELEAHDPVKDNEFQIKRLVKVWNTIKDFQYKDSQFAEDYADAVLMLSAIKEELGELSPTLVPRAPALYKRISDFLNGKPKTVNSNGTTT